MQFALQRFAFSSLNHSVALIRVGKQFTVQSEPSPIYNAMRINQQRKLSPRTPDPRSRT
jgi:hypothetical protein